MADSSYSRERTIGKNKTAVECLNMSHASEFISWGDFKVKASIKNVVLTKIGNDYSLKTKNK